VSDETKMDVQAVERELTGKTLQTYWYLIEKPTRTTGPRELQRALNFFSPSIAVHHLEKLRKLGLVNKTETGEYVLKEEVKVGILPLFIHAGRFLVPRYFFYSVLVSTMLIGYLLLSFIANVPLNPYALLFGLVSTIIFWVETVRLWKKKPF